MLSDRITVFIATYNEQHRVELAIRNFRGRLRLHVIDNFSTDGTIDILRRHDVPFTQIRNPGYLDVPEVMLPIQDICKTEYMLMVASGEFFPLSLLERLAAIAESGSHDIVGMYRYSITCGEMIPISVAPHVYYRGEMKFFRPHSISFTNNQIHHPGTPVVPKERILELGPARELAFYQFRDYDASQNEDANRRYNDIWAKQRFEAGQRFGFWRCAYRMIGAFVRTYFIRGAWRFGCSGLFNSMFRAIMEFQIQVRLWEHEHHRLKPDVQRINRAMRESWLERDGCPPLP